MNITKSITIKKNEAKIQLFYDHPKIHYLASIEGTVHLKICKKQLYEVHKPHSETRRIE